MESEPGVWHCVKIRAVWGRDFGSFLFLYFLFSFFTKNIFLFSKFTGIYPGRPAAGRPGPGRPAAGRQRLFCKKFRREFALRPLEDRSPGSGAAGPPRCPANEIKGFGGRLWHEVLHMRELRV